MSAKIARCLGLCTLLTLVSCNVYLHPSMVARMSPQQLASLNDANLCFAQRHRQNANVANEIARRNLNCNALAGRQGTPAGSKGQSTSTAAAIGAIRNVDFRNYSYRPELCIKEYGGHGIGGDVRLVDGQLKTVDVEYGIADDIIYGDITNDGGLDAVVQFSCWLIGANYSIVEYFVYTMRNQQPLLLDKLNDDDMERDYVRFFPKGYLWYGSGDIKIVEGQVITEVEADGAHCCPEYTVTLRYRWNGSALVLVGRPERIKFVSKIPENAGAPQAAQLARTSKIPEQFHGVWDEKERCKYGTESDSGFTVSGNEIRYYEALCTLVEAGGAGQSDFEGKFACEGEGQKWDTGISMRLEGGKLVHGWSGREKSNNVRCK